MAKENYVSTQKSLLKMDSSKIYPSPVFGYGPFASLDEAHNTHTESFFGEENIPVGLEFVVVTSKGEYTKYVYKNGYRKSDIREVGKASSLGEFADVTDNLDKGTSIELELANEQGEHIASLSMDSATTTKAGLMSAADKVKLNETQQELNDMSGNIAEQKNNIDKVSDDLSGLTNTVSALRIDVDGKVAKRADYDLVSKEDVARFNNHLVDFKNPHHVTKNDVGLGNVDNTKDSEKNVKSAVCDEDLNNIAKTYVKISNVQGRGNSNLPVYFNDRGAATAINYIKAETIRTEDGDTLESILEQLTGISGTDFIGIFENYSAVAEYLDSKKTDSTFMENHKRGWYLVFSARDDGKELGIDKVEAWRFEQQQTNILAPVAFAYTPISSKTYDFTDFTNIKREVAEAKDGLNDLALKVGEVKIDTPKVYDGYVNSEGAITTSSTVNYYTELIRVEGAGIIRFLGAENPSTSKAANGFAFYDYNLNSIEGGENYPNILSGGETLEKEYIVSVPSAAAYIRITIRKDFIGDFYCYIKSADNIADKKADRSELESVKKDVVGLNDSLVIYTEELKFSEANKHNYIINKNGLYQYSSAPDKHAYFLLHKCTIKITANDSHQTRYALLKNIDNINESQKAAFINGWDSVSYKTITANTSEILEIADDCYLYLYNKTVEGENYYPQRIETNPQRNPILSAKIVNDTTGGVNDVLSAEQGKLLSSKINEVRIAPVLKSGQINGNSGKIETGTGSNKHAEIDVTDVVYVRFMGSRWSASSSTNIGYAFYDENGFIVKSNIYDKGSDESVQKEYNLYVPEGATLLRVSVRVVWEDDFYCYVTRKDSVQSLAKELNDGKEETLNYGKFTIGAYIDSTGKLIQNKPNNCYLPSLIKCSKFIFERKSEFDGEELWRATLALYDNDKNFIKRVAFTTQASYNKIRVVKDFADDAEYIQICSVTHRNTNGDALPMSAWKDDYWKLIVDVPIKNLVNDALERLSGIETKNYSMVEPLVYTESFNVSLEEGKALIVDAKVIGDTKPTITISTSGPDRAVDIMTATIGGFDSYQQRVFPMPPFVGSMQTYKATVTIPEGVQLDVRAFRQIDKTFAAGYVEATSHLGMESFAPENTMAAFKMSIYAGYPRIIVTLVDSADGSWYCYHDGHKTLSLDGTTKISLTSESFRTMTNDAIEKYKVYSDVSDNTSYDGQPMAKFEDVVALCAISGTKICWSMHPLPTENGWDEIKRILDKYNMKIGVKASYTNRTFLASTYANLGEKYLEYLCCYESQSTPDITNNTINYMIGLNAGNVKKYVGSYVTESTEPSAEKCQLALSEGLGIEAEGGTINCDKIAYLIERGVTKFFTKAMVNLVGCM